MLNFSCEFKTKNLHYKFDSKLNLTKNGAKIDAKSEFFGIKEAVGVARALREAIERNNKDIFKKANFDEVVENIKLVEKARDTLISVRLCNISYGRGNRKEKMKQEINALLNSFYHGNDYYKFRDKLSITENIVLNKISNGRYFNDVCSEDFADKYDCLKQDKTKLNSLFKDLTSYPYDKYGIDTSEVQKDIKISLDTAQNKIAAYEMIVTKAGDDLVSWSQQKISRMLNASDIKGVSYWNISGWLDEKKEDLLSKGVEVKVSKPKTNKIDALKNKLGCDLTQDELLRLFKAGHNNRILVSHMTLDTLNLVLSSPLKCISKHYLDKWNRLNNEVGTDLINRFCEIAPKNKSSLNTITSFINRTQGDVRKIKEEYFFACEEFLDEKLVLKYLASKDIEVTASFYDKFLKNLDYRTILNLNSNVTKEFVSRLNEDEKVSILPRLFGKFLDKKGNSLNYIFEDYAWDGLDQVNYNRKDTTDLYSDVDWSLIRKEVLSDSKIRVKTVPLMVKNNDLETAEVTARNDYRDISQEERESLLGMFDMDTKIDIMVTCSQGNYYYGTYTESIPNIITNENDLLSLFKVSLEESESNDFISKIVQIALKRKYNLDLFRETIVNTDIGSFHVTDIILKLLDKKTKLHLLKENIDLKTSQNNTYYRRSNYTDHSIGEFFKGLTRKDIESVYGSNLSESKYYLYLNHLMTDEERIECCKYDNTFLKQHLKDIPYSYLKKYEDKNKFKELVGDRRNTENNNLGTRLENIFKEQLTQALDKPNSVKLMFE